MKTIAIALKDLTRSFRSAFALIFMFGVPLLVAGMFALMFGSQAGQGAEDVTLPAARTVIYNPGAPGGLGEQLAKMLQDPALAGVIETSLAADEAAARQAVDEQTADAAVILPVNLETGAAEVTIYHAAAPSAGAEVVKAVVGQMVDQMAGGFIAARLAGTSAAAQQYAAETALMSGTALVEMRAPGRTDTNRPTMAGLVAPILGGMMIFFAFFTGGNSSLTLLHEAESGALARLFTTPTRRASILGGKFLAVGLTVLVQVTVLLLVGAALFGIRWGGLGPVVMAALGIVACAAAFGLFLTSLMRSTRQGGVVFGGLMTVTGMLGMVTIFTGGGGGAVETVALLTPQGWAVRGLTLAMNGADLAAAALNLGAVLVLSAAFFGMGVWRLQSRFAGESSS